MSKPIVVMERLEFSTLDDGLSQKICDSSVLTSVEICSETSDWNGHSEQTKSISLSLIRMPTLRHLSLISCQNFPAATLSLCSGLKTLELCDTYLHSSSAWSQRRRAWPHCNHNADDNATLYQVQWYLRFPNETHTPKHGQSS
ncbi:hypothetical protein HYPSUDRAFT_1025289 [Hypholoma sublateritium FD-334 SS-4]|uniref:F-box domain-containing protein n=1 Tax=Hypholoma sublateritium (strain FD-334 SS-4) TaxID=945553 RepID=A0A0D2PAB1_HYPSF|nr:hypothetical protein HYPSUDRAFT_1025289 [Hypholoma sublateritium FD-334 SS-4]